MLRRFQAFSPNSRRKYSLTRAVRRRGRRLGSAERLEQRCLLAGDWDGFAFAAASPASPFETSPIGQFGADGESAAEGEDALDVVAFAKALSAAGVKYYGADWCKFCNQQEIQFGDGARFLPFIEVTNPDHTLNEVGSALNPPLSTFPTWEFAGGVRASGVQTFERISQLSGVPLPTSSQPTFAPIENLAVKVGSPLHVPIDGYDPNGGPLTITAVSSNPAIVTTTVEQSNPSLRMAIIDKNNNPIGDMVFQMYADLAPRVTGRILELAQSGFYDAANNATPVTFHRVIPDFVIQGGDPTGTGSGGSSLGSVDDQYHIDLQHNQSGVLSYAKSNDDTPDSQFFVTAGNSKAANGADVDQRNLDFNHSIVGQLIEGDRVRKTIERTPTDANDKPTSALKIQTATVFQDEENGLVMLKAMGVPGEQSDITITITDQDGHLYSQTFRVTVEADTRQVLSGASLVTENINSAPFLLDIPYVSTTFNTPVVVQLQGVDVENDPLNFDAVSSGTTSFTPVVNHTTGEITVTPPVGFIGTLELYVGVSGVTAASTVDQWDTQRVPIHVVPQAPLAIDLESAFDSGSRNDDNTTNLASVDIRVDGVTAGATVTLLKGSTVVKEAVAGGDSVTMNVDLGALGDGIHALRAVQRVNNETSEPTSELVITLDRVAPQFANTLVTTAHVAIPYAHDVNSNDELTTGAHYTPTAAPANLTIDPITGAIQWTPASAQAGNQDLTVEVTDVAGNSRTQQATILVSSSELVQYRVEATRLGGQAATDFEVGEDVVVNVYVRDLRGQPQGIAAAYVDLLFPSAQLTAIGNPTFGPIFSNANSGAVQASQLDEVGGATDGAVRDGDEQLLYSFQFEASAPGAALLQLDPADGLPAHATRLVGVATDLNATELLLGSQAINIFLPFTVRGEIVSLNEDTPDFIDVLANDFFHGTITGPLRVKELGTPIAGGQVSIAPDGRVAYVPPPNFSGMDRFSYGVTDDVTGTAQATVTVLIQPVNDAPTVVNDSFTGTLAVDEDSPATLLSVLTNDSIAPDIDEILRIVSIGSISNGGSVIIGPSGTHVTYQPALNFHGVETFTYTVSDRSDASGLTATATVTVEVKDVNDPPVANNDAFPAVLEDSPATRFDPLSNDNSGPDPQENLTIQSVTPQAGALGTINLIEGNKALTYQPALNFHGQELFVYLLSDGRGGTTQGLMRFTVTPANDPPIAVADAGNQRFQVSKNTTNNSIDVMRNDSSAPDATEVLLVKSVTPGTGGGELRVSDDRKSILFTPAANFVGTVTFQYTIEDPGLATATTQAEIEVLDFLGSSLAGFSYLDANRNGVFESTEQPLAGVTIALVGVDYAGAQVQRTERTATDGGYHFNNLAPGNYVIRQSQPEFLVDGRDTIGSQGGTAANDEFTIPLNDNVHGVNNNFGELGTQPRYAGFRDLFASASRQSVLLVVDELTGRTMSAGTTGWRDVTYTASQLSNDRTTWTFSLTDENENPRTLTLPNRFSRHLQILGRSGTYVLLRVLGAQSQVPLVAVAPQNGGAGEGEGEPMVVRAAPVARDSADGVDQVLASESAGAWRGPIDDYADLFASRRRGATSLDLVLDRDLWR